MSIGQGNVIVNQRKEPVPPPGPPFVINSADNGLSVDPVSGRIVLGQNVGAVGNPAQLLSAREIPMAGFDFVMTDPAYLIPVVFISPANHFFFIGNALGSSLTIDDTNKRVLMGNGAGAGNATHVITDDTLQTITAQSNSFRHLFIDQPTGLYSFGDIDAVGNGMQIIIADFLPTFFINSGGNNFFNIDVSNQQFNLDTTTGVLLQGDGATGLLNFVAPNGITTSNPGTGSGAWRLGQVKVAASVFDATRFVEINIGGAVVKLAVVV